MSLLLSIPREVRDDIINLIITSPRPAPSTSSPTSDNRFQRLDAYQSSYHASGYNILQEHLPNRTKFIPLLLVNRQLHDETIAAIQRLPNVSYMVDVMVYQERQLWPTWLLLPELSNNIDKIYTTFRIAGFPPPEDKSERRMRTGFSGGCGGPPYIEWCFLDLWESLLRIGPTGQSTQPRCVKLLELDVISPDPDLNIVAPLDVFAGDLPGLRASSGIDYILNPNSIIEIISQGLTMLLAVKQYAEEYGGILYEGLGTIRLLHDGAFCQEWNVTEMFASLQYSERTSSYSRLSGEERLAAFNSWKLNLTKRRTLVGLLESKAEDGSDEVDEVDEEVNEVEEQPESTLNGLSENVGDVASSSKEEDDAAQVVPGWKLALRKGKKLVLRKKTR